MPARKRKQTTTTTTNSKVKERKIEKDFDKVVVEEEEEDKGEIVSETISNSAKENEMKSALKIVCWNINGLRAWMKKESTLDWVKKANADIICFQEVKCNKEDIPKNFSSRFPGYQLHWLTGDRPGYAGIGMLTRLKPIQVTNGLGKKGFDDEGRVQTAEFDKFYLINAYVPNSGRGLPRLCFRTSDWEPAMRDFLVRLDKKKPIVLCGDLNVAHCEIDLANPKTNQKTAGFTPQERAEFDKLLKLGFVDSFRHFYPDKKDVYTFWSAMRNSRANNIGWRLDYFIVSKRFMPRVVDSQIAGPQVTGSDHCPIVLLANP